MRSHLNLGVSTAALAAFSMLGAEAAYAQAAPAGSSVETVTVTGTSIRGTAPVGSNLISVGQQDLQTISAATVTEVLATVPAITGLNNSGRGQNGNGGAGAAVYIHQIGASAQNSTLVLIDGHRAPLSGTSNAVVDPNIIPQPMLQRVEILADGSSATYGSDAVSGVVNFITRRNFDGIQLHYQAQQEDGAAIGHIGSVLIGKDWEGGSALWSYSYEFEDNIPNTARPLTDPLVQASRAAAAGLVTTTGSTTYFGNYNCGANGAAIRPNASGSNIFLSPTDKTFTQTSIVQNGVSVANVSAPCSQWAAGDLVSSDTTQHAMMKMTQKLASNLNFEADAIWTTKRSISNVSRGTLTATAFGPGGATGGIQTGQINPFFVSPACSVASPCTSTVAGVAPITTTQTKEEVRYDFNQLFGPGATSRSGNDIVMGDATLSWAIDDNWVVDFLVSAGRSDSYNGQTAGVVNGALANLALNGSTATNGTIPTATATSTSLAGTQSTFNNVPLTTLNALDVWNPVATNRTSAAVKAALIDPQNNNQYNHGVNAFEQFRAIANGNLFDLPAGPVKVAVGAEYYRAHRADASVGLAQTCSSLRCSTFSTTDIGRNVTSEFVELIVPVVGPEMNIPLVEKFELNIAGRHDDYDDVGPTSNPKIAFNWDVIEGLRLRGTWSKSFVAVDLSHNVPPGTSIGTISQSTGAVVLPVAFYPDVTKLGIPGCTTASVSCDANSSPVQGVNSRAQIANLNPETGKGWTLGVDYAPTWLPGFVTGATWWHVDYFGGATAATVQIDAFNPLLNNRIQLFPPTAARGNQPCATAAELAALTYNVPASTVIPSCVSYLVTSTTDNLINFWASGLDLSVQYKFDTDFGAFTIGDDLSQQLTFLQGFGRPPNIPTAATRFEVRNTIGLNTTFPNVGTQMRAHLDWAMDDITASIAMNYVGPYRNVDNTATVLIGSNSNNVYNGTGGDHVHGQAIFDLHLGYSFDGSYLGKDQVSLTVRNLFDTYPVYFNSASGYQNYVSSPIGRILELGFTAKL
jgi:iron complex outermembrane receptor protein